MERGPAPPEELATGNGGTLGGGTDGKDGPEGGIGDEGSLRTQPDVKEEDPLAEDNITEMRPLIAGSQAEVKGSGDGSSRAHLYRVSRYYCQCLQRTMEEFVERVNAAPLDEALFYRQEPEEVKQAAEIKERKEPSSHLLKMLTERDEPIGDAMVGFLARLHSTKQELQKILKDIKIKEDLVEAIGGKAHRSTGSQEDVISQDKEGTVSGKTGAVRNKRRLLDTMHFMSETRNASLLQMTKVTLGDCKDPGLAVSLCPLDCFVLAAALRPHGIVEELNISHCSIGPEGIQQLSSVLHLCKTLRLSWNNLGDSGVKILCSSLRQPDCEIQELWVDYNGLTAVGTRDLASAVAKNRSVVLLTLSYNKVGEATMKFLGDALKGRGCTLQYLRLCGMGITNSYCRQLAWALCANRSLTALDLDNNQLGDSGATQLCAALMKPDCKIQSLRLGSNRLTGLCTLELMHALNVNRSLRQLNLNYNRLGLPGVQRLSAALKRPTCRLQKLEAAALIASRSSHTKGQAVSDLQCCNNDDIIRGDFQTENTNWFMGSHMLELNCPMRLDENGLRDACAEELASALSTNRSLRGLYLNRNSFTDRSIPAFHSLAKSCTSLRYIWLWRNQFSPEGRNQLQSMMESVRRVTVFV